jgi:hypothetical protein
MTVNEPGGEGRVQRVPKPQENDQEIKCQGHDRRIRLTKYCDYIPFKSKTYREVAYQEKDMGKIMSVPLCLCVSIISFRFNEFRS